MRNVACNLKVRGGQRTGSKTARKTVALPEPVPQWVELLEPGDREKAQENLEVRNIRDGFNSYLATSMLCDIYEHLCGKEFETAINEFSALYELIRFNPHFKNEIAALKAMVEAESYLNRFSAAFRGI